MRSMVRARCLLILLHLISGTSGWAQLHIAQFTKYTTREGLSHNHIHDLCQDSSGFIWISTEYGLNRFDGTSFTNLVSINEKFREADQFISSLKNIGLHELGIGTQYGAYLLNTSNYQITRLQFEVDDNLKYWAFHISEIQRDTRGNIGLSTKTGFYVFNSAGQLIDDLAFYTADDIGQAWMLYGRFIYLLPDGQMMQKNSEGYNVFDATAHRILQNPPLAGLDTALIMNEPEIDLVTIPGGVAYLTVRQKKLVIHHQFTNRSFTLPVDTALFDNLYWRSTILALNDSTLLINGRKGLYTFHYSMADERITAGSELMLPELNITSFCIDKENRIWLGTSNGLYKQRTEPIITQTRIREEAESGALSIKYLEQGKDAWYAATSQQGLLILDEKTLRIQHQFLFKKDNKILPLGKIFSFSDEVLWIASYRGLFTFHKTTHEVKPLIFDNCPECTVDMFVQDIYQSRSGDIWITGNEGNKAYKVDPTGKMITRIEHDLRNEKFRVNIPFRIAEDAEGNIWFCGDAMARYNPTTGRIDSLIEKLPLQRNSKKPYFMHRNSKNDLWFITNSDNWHISAVNEAMEVFPNDRLSPSINIYQSMIDDVLHYISEQGEIITLNTLNRDYRILSGENGWNPERITSLGFYKDKKTGDILFAGDDIIYRFASGLPLTQRNNTPFISAIDVFGKRVIDLPGERVIFQPDENTMLLKFTSLNFTDPGNQLFSYKLDGNTPSSWISINKPEILLTQIPAGHFTLTLQVASKNQYWVPSYKTYHFTVLAPMYQRWTFIVPVALLLTLLLWLIIRYRLKEMSTISNLDRMVVEYELKALHAQMNPHFVFNCLNSIKEMIMSRDNKNANIYLNKFSYLLRSTLDQSKLTFIPLSQVIEYIRHYLEMEKLRFEHFKFSIETDPALNTESIVMAPMLLQPIVENAIWHGISNQKEGSQIQLRFYHQGETITCEVEDFGIGILQPGQNKEDKDHEPTALANIRKRIDLLNRKHNAGYQLIFIDKSQDASGQGTIVRLSFKYQMYEFD
jgi:ligand-binding sensor domain-containing protein